MVHEPMQVRIRAQGGHIAYDIELELHSLHEAYVTLEVWRAAADGQLYGSISGFYASPTFEGHRHGVRVLEEAIRLTRECGEITAVCPQNSAYDACFVEALGLATHDTSRSRIPSGLSAASQTKDRSVRNAQRARRLKSHRFPYSFKRRRK